MNASRHACEACRFTYPLVSQNVPHSFRNLASYSMVSFCVATFNLGSFGELSPRVAAYLDLKQTSPRSLGRYLAHKGKSDSYAAVTKSLGR